MLDRCDSWSVPETTQQTVAVVTSELVTNAVRHARTPFEVSVEQPDDGHVCISVHDHSTARPRRRRADRTTPGGLGLILIEQLSSGWGVTPCPDGKSVWAVLDVR